MDAAFVKLRAKIGQHGDETRQEMNNLRTDIGRLELVLESGLRTIGVAGRIARIEGRLALKRAPAA